MSDSVGWLGLERAVAFAGVYRGSSQDSSIVGLVWHGLAVGQSLVAVSPFAVEARCGEAKIVAIRWPVREHDMRSALVMTRSRIEALIPAIAENDLLFVVETAEDKIQELERRIRALEGKAAK